MWDCLAQTCLAFLPFVFLSSLNVDLVHRISDNHLYIHKYLQYCPTVVGSRCGNELMILKRLIAYTDLISPCDGYRFE